MRISKNQKESPKKSKIKNDNLDVDEVKLAEKNIKYLDEDALLEMKEKYKRLCKKLNQAVDAKNQTWPVISIVMHYLDNLSKSMETIAQNVKNLNGEIKSKLKIKDKEY